MRHNGIEYYSVADVAEKLGVSPKNASKTFERLRELKGMPHPVSITPVCTAPNGHTFKGIPLRAYDMKSLDDWFAATDYKSRKRRLPTASKSVEQILEEREIARLEAAIYE